ncbi:hypothetical protein FOA52_006994 [Chlamydomonas sp. UWO 241]|nr:hypothetical protein FOA52_006994 [Chlamydomonas sp. UWO 241]
MTNATASSEPDELDQCIAFLADPKRYDVKLVALDILTGLSDSPEGVAKLKTKLDKLLAFTLRLVPVPQPVAMAPQASEGALMLLVNLSHDAEAAAKMIESRVIARVMDYIKDGICPHPRLMAMLLANLTASDAGCSELLQLGQGKLEGLNIAVLLKKFMLSGMNYGMTGAGTDDPFEHVASVLTNVTRLKAARLLLLQEGRGLLQVLVAQLASPSELRRRGATGAIKNCCMQAQSDGTLEVVLKDSMVLTKMMGPINGEEPKELDDLVREAAAESVTALAGTKAGRAALWQVKAPEVINAGYALEEHPGVCFALERAGELFLSDSFQQEEAGGAEGLASVKEDEGGEAGAGAPAGAPAAGALVGTPAGGAGSSDAVWAVGPHGRYRVGGYRRPEDDATAPQGDEVAAAGEEEPSWEEVEVSADTAAAAAAPQADADAQAAE